MKKSIVLLVVLLTACDAESMPDASMPDSGTDAGPLPACEAFPAPIVAGTPETDAVADAAAQCGQAPFAWLREGIGEVVSLGESERFSRTVLRALAASQDVVLPRPPMYDAELQLFTYRTQDRGVLLDATALVAFPDRAVDAPQDMVLYLHGSTGFTDECAATADLASRLIASLIASYGYVVVMPDYIGLRNGGEPTGFLNPALVGQPTALASLDAVRAAARLTREARGGACVTSRFVTVGGSQGGHGALWIDRLAPYYARELTHLGVVATVPPADAEAELTRALTELGPSSSSAMIFFSTAAQWYGHTDRLDEVLVPPEDTRTIERLSGGCSRGWFDDFTSLDQIFTTAMTDAAAAGDFTGLDPWACMVRENGITSTSIPRVGTRDASYGVLFVTAGADTLVLTPAERDAFAQLCNEGDPIAYIECEGAGHIEGTTWALGELVDFLDARLREEPFVSDGCDVPAPITCSGTPE